MINASDSTSRIPEMEKLTAGLQAVKGFELSDFETDFSARAMSRGTLYSMEPGWIEGVKMCSEQCEEGGITVQGRCWASYEKATRREVSVTLDERTLRFKHSVCGCVAGLNACSHACGLLQYLAFLARYMRAVDAESQQSEEVPCTSLPRRWGVPSQKRAIAPTVPIDQLNLSHKPKQLECFSPVKASQAEDCERQVEKRPITPLVDAIRQHAKEEGLSMCFLAFFEPSPAPSPAPVQCPYNARRVKPLRFPERFSLLWSEQEAYIREHGPNTPPDNETFQRWKALFFRCVHDADLDSITERTKGQAQADDWFLERICRLTASRCKQVCTRQREFPSLVKQFAYVNPPTHLPALEYGRRKEPEACAKYSATFPCRLLSESGLVVKRDARFLAATPDRFVSDPSSDPCDGLLEVKCPFSTSDAPATAATTKKGFCLKMTDHGPKLDRSHQYYYQVRCYEVLEDV